MLDLGSFRFISLASFICSIAEDIRYVLSPSKYLLLNSNAGQSMACALSLRRRIPGCHLPNYGLPSYVIFPSCQSIQPTSKCIDHWQDVLVGSILGTVLAYFSYRQYYPSLESDLSHRPYSPRIKHDEEDVLPIHIRTGSESRANPFLGTQARNPERFTGFEDHIDAEDFELGGTVPRPRSGSLEEIWKDDEARSRLGSPFVDPFATKTSTAL